MASAARRSTAGWAAIGPAGWTPWPTAPIAPTPARIRCRPTSRPTCASYAAAIPTGGQRRLAHELARVGVDPPPGLTSIYRALVRNGLIQPRARRRRKTDYRRWERARPMQLWQLDVMGGIWLADGRELKAVTGIDDHSRLCVMAGLIERANARSVCRIFTAALARYGTPRKSSPITARCSPAASARTRARCCSTASAANKG